MGRRNVRLEKGLCQRRRAGTTGRRRRCLRVKATFKTYGGVAFCPKDVRASFVTWLRSGEHGDSVLAEAAKQMRHSSSMQASVHYDKARSERVVSAASRVADAFAATFK